MAKSSGFKVNKLIKLMTGFMTLELTSRAISGINVQGLPPAVPKVTALLVSASRFALLKPLTKDMPAGTGQIVNAMIGISSLQQTFAALPDLMNPASWTSSPN